MAAHGTTPFSSLLSPKEILCRVDAADRDEVISRLLKTLAYERGIGNVDDAFRAVLDREASMCTVVGPGIAMPHARLESIDRLVVGVATSEAGIDFRHPDAGPVHLVILILAPKANPAMYLQVISSLAAVCADPATARKLAALGKPEEVWKFFERGGVILPDYVCAGDIMRRDFVAVKETDPLETAIDRFVTHALDVLPVVDRDGDFVGAVTATELMRVCLPDYLLWMDDLSPILNFEPFAQVVRNEGKTWLAEIMSYDYAVIPEDAPAIEVAKEITKQGQREAFVTRGKKLVGVINLHDFLNKVLRE